MKVIVLVMSAVLLSSCASMPKAPQNADELRALGSSNLLNVPVDISGFTATKMKIVSEKVEGVRISRDGEVGQITIFTDPVSGKTYDLDGQPVNEKGERILNNGYACKVVGIANNQRIYGELGTWSETDVDKFCKTSYRASFQNKAQAVLAAGLITGGVAALAVIPTNMTIAEIFSDDTM